MEWNAQTDRLIYSPKSVCGQAKCRNQPGASFRYLLSFSNLPSLPIRGVDQADCECQYHGYKHRPDKLRTSSNHHPGAYSRPDELANSHDQTRQDVDVSGEQKKGQARKIAGEVHHVGVSGRPGEVETQSKHVGHRPERACPRPEKPVIKAQ